MIILKLVWLILESGAIISMAIFSYIFLWLFSPYNIVINSCISVLGGILFYDMFRTWVKAQFIILMYEREFVREK